MSLLGVWSYFITCPDCLGTGQATKTTSAECQKCLGSGRLIVVRDEGSEASDEELSSSTQEN